MCCGHRGHHGGRHGHGHGRGGDCGCGKGFRFGPCFATGEEKISWLEQYLEGLQEEIQAVEERIAKLKEEK
jgi:hypothetical protein